MENLIQSQISVNLKPYSEDLKEEWDEFVEQKALNSTFLHTRKFYDHNPLNSQDDASLIFYKDEKIIAVFPAILYQKEGRRILHSHLRSTYGGFITGKKVGVEEAVSMIEQVILYAEEKKVNQIIVRNPFRIFHSELCDETDYAMWYKGFKIKSRELEVAVQLYPDVDRTRSQYHSDAIRNVRKALKCIEIAPLDDLEEYWKLLEKCHVERHGKKPVHDFNSILKLIGSVGRDKVLAWGAYYNKKLIGGCIIFVANELALQGQYIASDLEFQHLKPVHALMDQAVQYGCLNGFRYFNFGMANEDDGKKINYGLFGIKEHFGGKGLLRETMYMNIL